MPNEPVTPERPAAVPTPVPGAVGPGAAPRGDDGAHPSGLTIIASKISPAGQARSVMTRPRLVGWFEQQRDARLVLVSAEAGYGKSTLLNDHAWRSDAKCVWYRIETSDGDWITFLSYMVATLREVSPGFGRSTEALLRHVAAMGSSREVVLAQFLADLGDLKETDLDVILDDYHLVEDSLDIRMIMSRLLERAPEGMRFILAGRGRPNLALGRLLAQGRVAELTIDDLRFTKTEIAELFATAYQQPLEEDACNVVAERTEGWAASLQLVSASIAVSRPSEVAVFIEALSGATGPIYDFLAEEVLTRLSHQTQRVLIHASLIDRVRPELVAAALSVSREAPGHEPVVKALADTEALGLLGDRSSNTGGRIHPLFRQFLEHHLRLEASPHQIQAMHLAVAAAAEPTDWLVASKHFALGGEPDEAMRVLGSAASEALGTGAWGAAVEIVDLMPDTAPPPSVEVIKARALVSDGRPDEAIALLDRLDGGQLNAEERGLLALTRAAAHHIVGNGRRLNSEILELAADEKVPSPLREVALSWREMLVAGRGGCISDVVESLRRLSADQAKSGLHYFAGVSLHNTANAELARGNYANAIRLANEAASELALTDDGAGILASTQSISAASIAELGDFAEGLRAAGAAATEPSATADAIAEAAYLHAVTGRTGRATSLLNRFDRGEARWSRELSSRAQAWYARIALCLSDGDLLGAQRAAEALRAIDAPDIDAASRLAVIQATLATVEGSNEAFALAREAVAVSGRQNAWRWAARARILAAITERDGESLGLWLGEAENNSALALLDLADPIAMSVGLFGRLPEALERSILRAPNRWVTALGRQVRAERSQSASAAAALIARFGSLEDAALLRGFDRAPSGKRKRRGLTAQLIRRVSPTVRVHDLGPTRYEVGDREVPLTEIRRKSGALLLFLATRTGLAATSEQTMESLWPDQSPKSARNSLHQTLFALRRDIEPWYEDGSTADYIRMESEMVFLDRDLIQVDSLAFNRQATDILATGSARDRGPEMLRLYKGEFAPEFRYEEWAESWRSQLHGIFLHLAYSTANELVRDQRFGHAVEVLTPAVLIDPLAFDLRTTLVGCLARLGSTDAAHAQHRSYALLHTRELGLPAPSFEEVVREFNLML